MKFLRVFSIETEYGTTSIYGRVTHPFFKDYNYWSSGRVLEWNWQYGFCFYELRRDRDGRIMDFTLPIESRRKYIFTNQPGWEVKFAKKFNDLVKKLNMYHLEKLNRDTMDAIDALD